MENPLQTIDNDENQSYPQRDFQLRTCLKWALKGRNPEMRNLSLNCPGCDTSAVFIVNGNLPSFSPTTGDLTSTVRTL